MSGESRESCDTTMAAADYILHDGIDDEFVSHQEDLLRYTAAAASAGGAIPTAAAIATTTGGTSHHLSSSLMLAADDLEIPLISVRSNNTIVINTYGYCCSPISLSLDEGLSISLIQSQYKYTE